MWAKEDTGQDLQSYLLPLYASEPHFLFALPLILLSLFTCEQKSLTEPNHSAV